MGRPRNPVPKYLHHKASGQARIRVAGKDIYLGPYGSDESKKEYDRIRAELASKAPAAAEPAKTGTGPRPRSRVSKVIDVLAAFWEWAKGHYRGADGKHTSEIPWLKESLTDVAKLYGHTLATEFGPVALKTIRQQWIVAGLARTTINARVNRVRRVFKWAASEELVPVAVHTALTTVAGLKKGRTEARESKPVISVCDLYVAATLPYMTPTLRAMVLVQRLTGCRPQDVRRVRVGQVNRELRPWVYQPPQHKTAYRGSSRTVYIGGAAAEILAPFLDGRQPEEVVFAPARALAERYALMRANRKSKVQPSQVSRAKPTAARKRKVPEMFTIGGYAHAVELACEKAGIPNWHPNQLRHKFGTEVRARFGLEAAQVLLGHQQANVTQVYAERDASLAVRVAEQMG